MVEKTAAFRQRRAADTARWRDRLRRGAAVYPIEIDGTTFDLMERFGGLSDSKTGDRQAVATASGKLLRRSRWRRCCGKKLLPGASSRVLINAGIDQMLVRRIGHAGKTSAFHQISEPPPDLKASLRRTYRYRDLRL
jgi:hypothetical protein